MVEKVVNIEAKTSFQPPLKIKEINVRCPKGYRLTKKNLAGTIKIEIRLSPTISLLLIQVSLRLKLRPKLPKKTNVTKETIKEVIYPVGSR